MEKNEDWTINLFIIWSSFASLFNVQPSDFEAYERSYLLLG